MPDDPNNPTPQPTPAPASAAPAAQPKVYRIPDPSKPSGFQEFDSEEKLIAAKAEQNQHIVRLNQEIESLKRQQAQFQQGLRQIATGGAPAPANDQFDKGEYYRLLDENPIEAQRYVRKFDPEWNTFQESLQKQRLQSVVGVFLSNHPDFQPTPDAVQGFLATAQQLGFDERTITPQQLDAAYAYYSMSTAKAKAQPPAQPNAPGATPPPPLPTSVAPPTDAQKALIDKMNAARNQSELDEVLRQAGIMPPSY